MQYMVVFNTRIGLKIEMKTGSPYENCPTLVESFGLAKKMNGYVLLITSGGNFDLLFNKSCLGLTFTY
jgi:hypothetical protein